jgi:hypothetical protein
MLTIINGTLDATWGLKVVGIKAKSKRKTKPTEYRLVNENVNRGIFNNPIVETTLMFGRYTPVLGIIHDGDLSDDLSDDLSEDLSNGEVLTIDTEDSSKCDLEHKLEFLRMLVSKKV